MPELNNQNFNHLKIHTQYSICEGAIKIDNLKDFCKEKKIACLGLSDTSNLCGALEFAENISKVGTQPIIGCVPALEIFSANSSAPHRLDVSERPKQGILFCLQ